MKNLLCIIISIIYFSIICISQNITIKAESGVDELIQKHIEFNQVVKGIQGYRIQIFSSSGNFSRSNALVESSRFQSRYPAILSYVVFNTPYYIVRVGNFRTRLEAEAFRQSILRQYPGAYIVKEFIELPK